MKYPNKFGILPELHYLCTRFAKMQGNDTLYK